MGRRCIAGRHHPIIRKHADDHMETSLNNEADVLLRCSSSAFLNPALYIMALTSRGSPLNAFDQSGAKQLFYLGYRVRKQCFVFNTWPRVLFMACE